MANEMRNAEAKVIAEIAASYSQELAEMSALHDAVFRMLSSGPWKVTKASKTITPGLARTMVSLLTKACKTYRSIQILSERGYHDDAGALVRVLLETSSAILFILQRKCDLRVRMYQAYTHAQSLKMLNEWKRTKGLKRRAPKKLVNAFTTQLANMEKTFPAGTDIRSHWSGMGSLQNAMKAMRQDRLYSTLYRTMSATVHAADFTNHVSADDATDDLVYQVYPRSDRFAVPSLVSRLLLWSIADRIDDRLGLGFSASLAPHRVTAK